MLLDIIGECVGDADYLSWGGGVWWNESKVCGLDLSATYGLRLCWSFDYSTDV